MEILEISKKELRNKFGIQCAFGGTIGMFSSKKPKEITIQNIPHEYYKAIIVAFFQFQKPDSNDRYEAIL